MNIKHLVLCTLSAWGMATAAMPFTTTAAETAIPVPANSVYTEQVKEAFKTMGLVIIQHIPNWEELIKSKVQGDSAKAQVAHALMYMTGIEREQDIAKAIEILSHNAAQGEPYSQVLLANIYCSGIVGEEYYDVGVRLTQQAAQKGIPTAIEQMILFSIEDEDFEAAKKWSDRLDEVAAENPMFTLRGQLIHKALLEAAEKGNPLVQYECAIYYWLGFRGFEEDEEAAFLWCSKAAAQNHPEAIFFICFLYCEGIGTPKDTEKALQYAQKAVELGLPDAQELYEEVKAYK